MLNETFLSLTLTDLIGFAITSVGIWLVVRQLRETKLASQMEGMLALGSQSSSFDEYRKLLTKLIETEKWQAFSGKDAYDFIFAKEKYREAYLAMVAFFERLAILVRRHALDTGIAYDFYGRVVALWWHSMEKVTLYRRAEQKQPELGEHWEWLVEEFEKH